MRNKIIAGVGLTIVLIIFTTSFQISNEQKTLEPKTINKYTEIVSLKPHPGDSNLYTYSVKVCAASDDLDIVEIILQSDIDEQKLGVYKTIQKGDCSTFGSVMKAEKTETFSIKIIENRK